MQTITIPMNTVIYIYISVQDGNGPENVQTVNIPVCRLQFSSVQDGIYALGKAHMRPIPSFRSFPNEAFETIPMFQTITVPLNTVLYTNDNSSTQTTTVVHKRQQ